MSDAAINELEDSQFGDPSKINESRLLAGERDPWEYGFPRSIWYFGGGLWLSF